MYICRVVFLKEIPQDVPNTLQYEMNTSSDD